jgi:hypothetical protein
MERMKRNKKESNGKLGRKSNPSKLTSKQKGYIIKKIEYAVFHPRNAGRDKIECVLHALRVYIVGQWKKQNLACVGNPNVSSDYLKHQFIANSEKSFVAKIEEEDDDDDVIDSSSDKAHNIVLASSSDIICKKEEEEGHKCAHTQQQKILIKKEELDRDFIEEQRAINEVDFIVKNEEKEEDGRRDPEAGDSIKIIKCLEIRNPRRFRAMIVLKALRSLGIQHFLIHPEDGKFLDKETQKKNTSKRRRKNYCYLERISFNQRYSYSCQKLHRRVANIFSKKKANNGIDHHSYFSC